ncbi:MAG: hypothetical protein ABIO72_03765 [Patescibacteria group bacterium]
MADARSMLLKTLAFHETWKHAPTRIEWMMTLDGDASVQRIDVEHEIDALLREKIVVEHHGRILFPDAAHLMDEIISNELFAPRKRRVARRAVSWLARLAGVRFVALCNTNALGHANDGSDLDFFIVTRAGTIAQTRALATLLFKFLGRRPKAGDERDTVCLSYFVSDDGLDLSSHMLPGDDPYFRYWFLSMVPLFDDGVSAQLWGANRAITSHHPFATRWEVSPDLSVAAPSLRVPTIKQLESIPSRLQARAFPASIRELKNRDTRVIVTSKALKFHVTDGREAYRSDYHATLVRRGLAV